jgi:hypothetical protein
MSSLASASLCNEAICVSFSWQSACNLLIRLSLADDVQSLSHIWVGLAAPNLAELEVAKHQVSEKEPP